MKVKEYNQMMSYLTRPGTQKDRFKKIFEKNNPDNSPYMLNNGELMTENQFKKSLPIKAFISSRQSAVLNRNGCPNWSDVHRNA